MATLKKSLWTQKKGPLGLTPLLLWVFTRRWSAALPWCCIHGWYFMHRYVVHG